MSNFFFDKTDKPKEAEKIIRKGVKQFKSTTEIRNELKEKGIKIRKQNVLYDIRKIKSEYNIKEKVIKKTVDDKEIKITKQIRYKPKKTSAQKKKEKWFNEVFEPLRKKYGLSSKQASKIINQRKLTTKEILEYNKINKAYWDYYKKVF